MLNRTDSANAVLRTGDLLGEKVTGGPAHLHTRAPHRASIRRPLVRRLAPNCSCEQLTIEQCVTPLSLRFLCGLKAAVPSHRNLWRGAMKLPVGAHIRPPHCQLFYLTYLYETTQTETATPARMKQKADTSSRARKRYPASTPFLGFADRACPDTLDEAENTWAPGHLLRGPSKSQRSIS